MSADQLKVTIITPEKKYEFEKIDALFAPGKLGNFEVLPLHAAMISELVVGVVSVSDGDAMKKICVSTGYCEIKDNNITILVESAETEKEIDVKRAKEAKHRAEIRLKEKSADIDIKRAELALMRSINRLKFVGAI